MATPEEIERVKKGLANISGSKRWATVRLIQGLPTDEGAEVMAGVIDKAAGTSAAKLLERFSLAALLGMPVLIMSLCAAALGNAWLGMVTTIAFTAYIALIFLSIGSQIQKLPVSAIAEVGLASNERLVGPLLRFYAVGSFTTRTSLLPLLAVHLPTLSKEGYAELHPEERTALTAILGRHAPPAQKAALDALSRAEATSALPQIERVALRDRDPSVRQCASACLNRLYELHDAQQDGAVLLRPSQSDSAPGTLLRPVASSSDEDEQQLLRPHE